MPHHPLDVDPDSLDALDFGALLEWVSGYARTTIGAAEVVRAFPIADPSELAEAIETTDELIRLIEREGSPVPGGLPGPEEGVARLFRGAPGLQSSDLRDVAAVLHAVGELSERLGRLEREAFPRLAAIGSALPDLRGTTAEVLRSIAPDGTLEDDASPELKRLRRARAATAERLERRLRDYLHRPDADVVIRDDFVTQRNGRFVIPVRTDAPRPIQGIVHATSSSGVTQFVEPLETVETNNELVRLAEQEKYEIARLVTRWADALRDGSGECDVAFSGLARLDAVQARALFGRETAGALAEVVSDGALRFEGLRHPLLERRLRADGRDCLPLDLVIDPADRVLVLSGPNAGGKTVALKTMGLAVLMAQCAVPVPASRLVLPLFHQLRADIGDHQSMQADLSTFSAHLQVTGAVLAGIRTPALLLFDEIGTGTDPAEGAALAQAVLESLMRPGVTAIATTHQSSLKAWAHTTAGAGSAAMEFDTERLRPTFRILPETAGVSAGFEIAERMGLSADVVARARQLLGPDQSRAEDYLNRLQRQSLELESLRADVERQALELEREASRASEQNRAALERERVRLRTELDRGLRRLEKRTEDELRRIEDEGLRHRARRRAERLRARTGGELGAAISARPPRSDSRPALDPARLEQGQRVWVDSLGRCGVIDRIEDGRVRVVVGSLPTRVDPSELREPAADDPAKASPSIRVSSVSGSEETVERELKLLGLTVAEAEEALDRYLDRAVMAGLGEVRVIHGHGTGRLKRAVRAFLAGHAQVRTQRPGRPAEGGDGATIVTLN